MTLRLHFEPRESIAARAELAAELAVLIDLGYRLAFRATPDGPRAGWPEASAELIVVGPQADRLAVAARALAANVIRVAPPAGERDQHGQHGPWTSGAGWADYTDPSRRWPNRRPPAEGPRGPGVDAVYLDEFQRAYLNDWTPSTPEDRNADS